MDVILNGEPFAFNDSGEVGFEEICKAAGMKPKDKKVIISIRHGGVMHLLPGEKTHVSEGAVINVTEK